MDVFLLSIQFLWHYLLISFTFYHILTVFKDFFNKILYQFSVQYHLQSNIRDVQRRPEHPFPNAPGRGHGENVWQIIEKYPTIIQQ